jgi:hypothetical protein
MGFLFKSREYKAARSAVKAARSAVKAAQADPNKISTAHSLMGHSSSIQGSRTVNASAYMSSWPMHLATVISATTARTSSLPAT